MTANEIVNDLRSPDRCNECVFNKSGSCYWGEGTCLNKYAADCIEQLQNEKTEQAEKLINDMEDFKQKYHSELSKNEQLQKELEENQASVIKLAVTFGTFQVEAHKALQTNKALHKELEAAKRDLKFCPCCETCKRENEVNCFLEAEEDKCINFEWRGACENKEENT